MARILMMRQPRNTAPCAAPVSAGGQKKIKIFMTMRAVHEGLVSSPHYEGKKAQADVRAGRRDHQRRATPPGEFFPVEGLFNALFKFW